MRAPWRRDRSSSDASAASPSASSSLDPAALQRIRKELYQRLLESIENQGGVDLDKPETTRLRVRALIDECLGDQVSRFHPDELRVIEQELCFEVAGLGPLGPLFADPTISDILVNGPDQVWVDRNGQIERTDIRFDDAHHLRRLLDRLVSGQGRHIDDASPMVDARLEDGSRLHALLPPLCALGPVLSIRRFRAVPFTFPELIESGGLSRDMAAFLEAAVKARLNMVIAGGAASGKTTLLNLLGSYIGRTERVVTIEETSELRLGHPHVIPLEARLANVEGRGEVTLRALVKNALRMRADRIIVGEVRGPEVFDMLQAMNIGHDGSLTTVHANNPEDTLRRLESLVLMSGISLPSQAIRELLGSAFNFMVQLTRFADGSRRVTSIRELSMDGTRLATRELFRFVKEGTELNGRVRGRHAATGEVPACIARLAEVGYTSGARPAEDTRRDAGRDVWAQP